MKQLSLKTQMDKDNLLRLANKTAYGGTLLNTRAGRSGGRPLSTKQTIHLVLRSTKAKGAWSFLKPKNDRFIRHVCSKFAKKYGVKILDLANVGNHLHFKIQLTNRRAYFGFIRAITGAIALGISGQTRWAKMALVKVERTKATSGDTFKKSSTAKLKFWDHRPFTRIITSLRQLLSLNDYIAINKFEAFGYTKRQARFLFEWEKNKKERLVLT